MSVSDEAIGTVQPAFMPVAVRLARGSAIYAITSFGLRVLGFSLLAIYSRFLSPGDYGIVILAESVAMFVGIVAGLYLDSAARRLYFQYVDQPDVLPSYVSSLLRFAAVSVATIVGLVLLTGPIVASHIAQNFQVPFYPYLALAIITAAAGQLVQCRMTIYQCENRALAFAAFAAVQFSLTTAFTLYFVVFLRRGATGMLTGRALGAIAALLLAAVVSRRLLRPRWHWRFVRETLHVALPLVPHGLMATGLIAADRFILQHYRPMSEVGLYSLAYSLGMGLVVFTSALWQAWSPLFFGLLREGERGRTLAASVFARVVLILAAIACVGALVSDQFVRVLFDPRFREAGRVAPIIIGAYLCHALFLLFQLSALQAKRTSWVWLVSSTALAVNIALNFAFAPRWGMYGAAYATLIAYGIEMAFMYLVAQRLLPMPYGLLGPGAAVSAFAAVLICSQLRTYAELWFGIAGIMITVATLLYTIRWLKSGLECSSNCQTPTA